jgi:hypothetical protein
MPKKSNKAMNRTDLEARAPDMTLTTTFSRFAGYAGIIAGVSSILYAVAFLILKNSPLAAGLLVLGSLLATVVWVMLYMQLRQVDEAFALLGLLFGVIGSLGAAIHGMTDLAIAILPPATKLDQSLPNPIDPRGFLAFGLTGVSVLIFAWLVTQGGPVPHLLGYVGYILAAALVALFLGNLFVNSSSSLAILIPGGVASLLANPIWLIGLGIVFLRGTHS